MDMLVPAADLAILILALLIVLLACRVDDCAGQKGYPTMIVDGYQPGSGGSILRLEADRASVGPGIRAWTHG